MDNIRSMLLNKMKATGKSNELSFKFKIMNTAESRIISVFDILESYDIVPPTNCKSKDSKESMNFRNKANKTFISSKNNIDKLLESWELYSKAVATAPNKSQELSLAYASRSALLFCLQKYEECIEDINRALELNYPNLQKGKILLRKIKCFGFLNRDVCKKNSIEEANCWLAEIHLSDDQKKELQKKLDNLNSNNKSLNKFNENKKEKMLPKIVYNNLLTSASEALGIQYNNTFGRHIVSTRKINAGEILIVEKAYATMLIPEKVNTHCSHCLSVHWALIPCDYCINAMYCSNKCKNDAWKQYHDIECYVTGYLLELNFNKSALFSMRLSILALKESGSVDKLKNDLEQANTLEDTDKNRLFEHKHRNNNYYNVYTLVTNEEKRSTSDLFERTLNASFIMYYLCTYTALFGKKFESGISQISTNKDVAYIGGLILQNMQIIPSNIHCYEEEYALDVVDIGISAQPFCSLINHSCDPNVSRCSTKSGMIIFAIVPIEENSQIFDNYGSHYATMNKLQREQKLNQYYFKCECRACKEDWPMYENLSPYNKFITSDSIKEEIEAALFNLESYVNSAKEDNIENKLHTLEDLSYMISIVLKYVPMPCSTVNNIIETLKRVFFLTYGNKFEIPKIA